MTIRCSPGSCSCCRCWFFRSDSSRFKVMERSSGGVRNVRHSQEEEIFFVYDRDTLKSEWDNQEDAIIYFSPTTMDTQEQCSLCGQLIGMVGFTEVLMEEKPTIIRLKKGKFAIKCVKNVTMALGGKLSDPDNLLFELLTDLYGIFKFFHLSFESFTKKYTKLQEFRMKMFDIWNCYLPFIKNYRQDFLTFMKTTQYVDNGKAGSFLYLKALQILESCQRRPDAICGCIFSQGRVVVSQIHPELLRFLSFLKPGQTHLPVDEVKTDSVLPHGVRIFPVYLKKKTLMKLSGITNRSPYAFMKNNDIKELNFKMRYETGLDNAGKNQDLLINCGSALADRTIVEETCHDSRFLDSKFLKSRKMSDSSSACHDTDNEVAAQDSENKMHSLRPATKNDALPFGTSSSCQINEFQDTMRTKRRQSDSSELSSIKDNSRESDIDAVWEVEFGGQLKDLRESVERFNKFYEIPEKLGDSASNKTTLFRLPDKSKQPKDLSCGTFITVNDSDDIAVTAYRRTCEYIYSCSENALIDETDEKAAPPSEISIDACDSPLRSSILIAGANSSPKQGINLSINSDEHKKDESEPSHANSFNSQNSCLKCHHYESKCKERSSSIHSHLRKTSHIFNNISKFEGDLTAIESEISDHNFDQSEVSHLSSDFDLISLTNEEQQSNQNTIKDSHSCGPNESNNVDDELVRDTLMSVGNALKLGTDTFLNPHHGSADFRSQDTDSFDACLKHSDEVSDNPYVTDEESTKRLIDVNACRQSKFSNGSLSEKIAKALSGEDDAERQEDAGYYSMDKDLDGQRGSARNDGTFARVDEDEQLERKSSDEDDGEDLKMMHLYVQAHSNTILAVLFEPQPTYDQKSLKLIYETVIPLLGDLEVSVQNSIDSAQPMNDADDFAYFIYNGSQKKCKGNCKFISQQDYAFGNAIKILHSQFINSRSMVDASFRDYTTAVYGKYTHGQESYYQQRGTYKPLQEAPTPYDTCCVMDRRINRKAKKANIELVL